MPFPNPSTQFKPGNPGRPKGRSITDRLKALLDQTEIGGKAVAGGKRIVDLLAETIVKQALRGDFRFVDLILQRTEDASGPKSSGSADDDVGTLREHLDRLRAVAKPPGDRELLGSSPRKRGRVRKPQPPP